MQEPELALIRRALDGQADAVRALIERFQGLVFGLCFRMLGHRQDAEDVAQEVFVRAIRSLHHWDETRQFRPWLLTIAANRCRTHLGNKRRIPRATEFIGELADEVQRPAANTTDLAEELQRAVDGLREDYRLVFTLYHQQEQSLAEISAITGCPEGTIKTWLFRARRELAESLRKRGIVAPNENELQRL